MLLNDLVEELEKREGELENADKFVYWLLLFCIFYNVWKKPTHSYHPGQFAFICVPGVTSLEWHPISFSSAPGAEYTTFHVKASGDWSKKLYKFAGK